MKHLFTLLVLTFILGCNNPDKRSNDTTTSFSLQTGVWYYKGYIDTTILTKKIYDYSWTCASFAYEITIDSNNPDSCYFKGYHEESMLPLKRINDKTYHVGDNSRQYWILTLDNNSEMTMKEYRDKSFSQTADPHSYSFEKKKETINDLKKYFVKNILSGVYRDSLREITLTDNYEIIGLDSLSSFDIELDFWEMVPGMDLIYLKSKNDNVVRYNWTFNNNELTLKNVHDIYKDGDWDGGIADTIVY
ncbi:MAG: hypothetical protein J0M25_14760, partial [Flavobacteriales bacterium]|nr:hypothetical protein [Flavobacteriales bacterium]